MIKKLFLRWLAPELLDELELLRALKKRRAALRGLPDNGFVLVGEQNFEQEYERSTIPGGQF